MPELPEVETTCRGIEPHLFKQTITAVVVRQPRLRWPVPDTLKNSVGQVIYTVMRRAKYILINTKKGTILLHLGMSGSLRLCQHHVPPEKHDHLDILLPNQCLRFRDPRRFGAVLWVEGSVLQHPLLAKLGVEPLSEDFHGEYLHRKSLAKRISIKQFIMNAQIVVGIGNIYASEALFLAGIHPEKAAGAISLQHYQVLVQCIRQILQQAIEQGGTTLRDFVSANGQTGYFQIALRVYGRSKQPCVQCQTLLQHIRQGQRSTWYCPKCQT